MEQKFNIKNHKKTLILLDIAFVLAILSNFGALLLTNMMVIKEEPNIVLMETNPIASKIHNFEQHPEGSSLMLKFVINCLLWSLIIFGYVYTRIKVKTKKDFDYLIFFTIFVWYTLTYDFINNLGLYIGKLIWGG
jgi:hypothetical protein